MCLVQRRHLQSICIYFDLHGMDFQNIIKLLSLALIELAMPLTRISSL